MQADAIVADGEADLSSREGYLTLFLARLRLFSPKRERSQIAAGCFLSRMESRIFTNASDRRRERLIKRPPGTQISSQRHNGSACEAPWGGPGLG